MNTVFLLLGTNLGDRLHSLDLAIDQIKTRIGEVIKASQIYETEPWGEKDQPAFYNIALELITPLTPAELIDVINNIEKGMGRERSASNKWKERTIDIDILFYDQLIIETENLVIPHPRFHMRKFAIIPMMEIAPEYIHPVLKKDISILLTETADKLEVKPVCVEKKGHK